MENNYNEKKMGAGGRKNIQKKKKSHQKKWGENGLMLKDPHFLKMGVPKNKTVCAPIVFLIQKIPHFRY